MITKQVIKIIDDNNQIMEMYSNQNGDEVKVMSVEMVKQDYNVFYYLNLLPSFLLKNIMHRFLL